jgi:hypothetical protein
MGREKHKTDNVTIIVMLFQVDAVNMKASRVSKEFLNKNQTLK